MAVVVVVEPLAQQVEGGWGNWTRLSYNEWWSWRNLFVGQLSDDDVTSSWWWWWLQVSDSNLLQVVDLLLWSFSNDVWVLVHIKTVLVEWESWSQIVTVVWVLVSQEVLVNDTGRQAREGIGGLVLTISAGRSELGWQDTAYLGAIVLTG